jgi:gamma-aminobutyric acid type B receptor
LGDRVALTQIEQMKDGKYVKLGYYDTVNDNLTWYEDAKWIGMKENICALITRINF